MNRTAISLFFLAALVLLFATCEAAKASEPGNQNIEAGVPSLKAPAVTVDELKNMLCNPDLLVLDVRIETDWERSDYKIAGAVRKNPNTVGSWADQIDKDKQVVTY